MAADRLNCMLSLICAVCIKMGFSNGLSIANPFPTSVLAELEANVA